MDVSLPPALAAAIANMLEGVSRNDLARREERQSAVYRGGGTSAGIATGTDALAYLVWRLPATFAALSAVFARVGETVPDFAPARFLDIGAGPGTASWAAAQRWPTLTDFTLVDRNDAFLQIARTLAAASLGHAAFIAADARRAEGPADLVAAGYVLAEFADTEAADIARHLWTLTEGILVLVEPGTPAGFARIRAAREALRSLGAHIVAPCTHDLACPMQGGDWCHFSQRLPRTRDHMIAKSASVPFEDERYSYLAVSRTPVTTTRARIVRPPVDSKPGLSLTLCEDGALHERFVARREKDSFRQARKHGWGDSID